MPSPVAGSILIASPILADPNFMRTLVYLLEHNDSGSLGLVLNRPLDMPLGGLWDECPTSFSDAHLCAEGGPVERNKGLLIHGFTELAQSYTLCEGLAVGGDPDQLSEQTSSEATSKGPRLFLGHAGWGAGQLVEEIAMGSWIVRHGHPSLLLNPKPPEDLWQELVCCGSELPEPSLN